MEYITVGGKKYDPYFILDVTKDDTNEHISKAFRTKVKKYHPDKYTDPKKKEKYECYFKILSESFQYIKNRREQTDNLQLKKKYYQNSKASNLNNKEYNKEIDIQEFNKNFEEKSKKKTKNKNNNLEDSKTKDTKKNDTKKESREIDSLFNQFSNTKFCNKKFNKMFEYVRDQNEDREELKIIHRTTDGFNGYNSTVVDNCALVSSYNGLLITNSEFDDSDTGYWGDKYGDYNLLYKMNAKNPNRKIKVPKDYKSKVDQMIALRNCNENELRNDLTNDLQNTGDFESGEKEVYKKLYNDLMEKEKYDKEIVLKYIDLYDQKTVNKALNGELECSPKYSSVLRKYLR